MESTSILNQTTSSPSTATKNPPCEHNRTCEPVSAPPTAVSPTREGIEDTGSATPTLHASPNPPEPASTTTTSDKSNKQFSQKQQPFKWSATKKDERKIFIGGLPQDVEMEEFRTFFSKFGEILDAVVMLDRNTRRSRGFGFVTYADPAVSKKLILTGNRGDGIGRIKMRGKTCEIKPAQPKSTDATLSPPSSNTSSKPSPNLTKNVSSKNDKLQPINFPSYPSIPDLYMAATQEQQHPPAFIYMPYSGQSLDPSVYQFAQYGYPYVASPYFHQNQHHMHPQYQQQKN